MCGLCGAYWELWRPGLLIKSKVFITLVKGPDKCPSVPIREFPTVS